MLSTKALLKVDRALQCSMPGCCCFCLGKTLPGQAWCRSCLGSLPWNTSACRRCAEPMPMMEAGYCGRCLRQAPAFIASYVGLRYEREIIALMHRFKFQGESRAGVLLASLMLETLSQIKAEGLPQTLVSLPRHPSRAREFGFDQAAWLADYLSRRLGIPVVSACRTRHTPTQRGLDRQARQKNLQNAFHVTESLRGRVAVVDDIMTTGASMDALAHACQVAGAEEVTAWAIARTPREQH